MTLLFLRVYKANNVSINLSMSGKASGFVSFHNTHMELKWIILVNPYLIQMLTNENLYYFS